MATFYRVVKTNPPTESDFISYRARGIRLRRDTPENRRLWEGVSVASSLGAARNLAARFPVMGQYIAVLDVPEGGLVRFEQTTDVSTHYTLWGEPRVMLEMVISVVPL